MAGLPLGTDAAVHLGGALDFFLHVQVGVQRKGVIGAAVHLDRHAVHDLDLDAAAGVAVEADGVQGVLGLHQLVRLELGQLSCFHTGDEAAGEVQLRSHHGTAADQRGFFEEVTAADPVFAIICHTAPPRLLLAT